MHLNFYSSKHHNNIVTMVSCYVPELTAYNISLISVNSESFIIDENACSIAYKV